MKFLTKLLLVLSLIMACAVTGYVVGCSDDDGGTTTTAQA